MPSQLLLKSYFQIKVTVKESVATVKFYTDIIIEIIIFLLRNKLSKSYNYQNIYNNEYRFENPQNISEVDNICLVYPLYQLAMPAVMKGYIDRVLTQGFSYSYKEDGGVIPHMKGKRISLFSPMGASMEYAIETGNIQAINHIVKNTFEFRGFEIKTIQYFDCNNRDKQLDDLEEKLMS
ncbi:MAG: NAD(P)H-dependent oxidoreductase [Candidatus Brocadia sp.]|nr:NAD(P)H-dependent oxidoreductase [Candidatus Brocadia sp.]